MIKAGLRDRFESRRQIAGNVQNEIHSAPPGRERKERECMNPNVLRYAIEVERCRSITRAARQLFVSQPNLSRDIRDLEEEIGFSLFTRSSRGVVPTEKGREFLLLARKAVQQFQALEAFCSHEDKDRLQLEICVPKSPGFSASFGQFLSRYGRGRTLSVDYRETGALEALQNVSMRCCHMAVIRIFRRHREALIALLRQKELAFESLQEFEERAVFSDRHPLASEQSLTEDMLEKFPEIVCEDASLAAYFNEPAAEGNARGIIRVQEHGSLLDLLSRISGSFAFLPPLPEPFLSERHLVARPVPGPSRAMTDLAIYPEDSRLTRAEEQFLKQVRLDISRTRREE